MATMEEKLERIRKEEIEKRIKTGQESSFRITPMEGDHPFYTVVRVVGKKHIPYDVEIHSLTNLDENYCTCGDYRYNGLGVCKHIVAAMEHLRSESPDAFEWTKSKNPRLENALYPKWLDGREVLYLTTDDGEVLERAREFFDSSNVLSDLSVVTTQEWKDFLSFLRERSIHITDMAKDLMSRWKHINKVRTIVSNHLPDGFPPDLLRHKAKKFQQDAASRLLGLGRLVFDASQGWGKRVATILAMSFLDRFVGPENQYVIVGPQEYYTQWRLLLDLFMGHPIYRLTLRGGRRRLRSHLEKDKFFYASYETIQRDGWIVREIEPVMLVFDEIQRVENWTGSRGSVLKSLEAPYVAFLVQGLRSRPELMINLAQYLNPSGFGPMWQFLYEHVQRNRYGRIERYDTDYAWKLIEPFFLDPSGRTYKSRPKRPRIRIGVYPTARQRDTWSSMVKKLSALTAVKYEWNEREVEQARTIVRAMRHTAGMLDPSGTPETPKFEALLRILKDNALEDAGDVEKVSRKKPGTHLKKRVVIFTHWPELLDFIKEKLDSLGYSTFVLKEEKDLALWESHNVALMYDKPYNPEVRGVDLLIHYDWPWEKNMLEKGRRALILPREESRLVEISLFTRSSMEDVGLRLIESMPDAIGEWFDEVTTRELPAPEKFRLICTRLVLYLGERFTSGRYRVQSGIQRHSRRVPMLGKGTEIENPGSFVRPKARFQMDSLFDSGPRAVISKQILWEPGIAMPDYADTPVLCDVKHTVKGFLTAVMSSQGKGVMAWKSADLNRLALALNKASFILALETFPGELRTMLFGIKVTSLTDVLSEAAGERVNIMDVLEQTVSHVREWSPETLDTLGKTNEWAKIGELSKQDLEAAWTLLAHMAANGSFKYTSDGTIKEARINVGDFLPDDLISRLNS